MGHIRQLIAVAIENEELPFTFFLFCFSQLTENHPSYFVSVSAPHPPLCHFCIIFVSMFWQFIIYFLDYSRGLAPTLPFCLINRLLTCFLSADVFFPSVCLVTEGGVPILSTGTCGCFAATVPIQACVWVPPCLCVCPGGILEGFSHNPLQSAYLDFTFA